MNGRPNESRAPVEQLEEDRKDSGAALHEVALNEVNEKLTFSERRFRELFDNAPDMYHTVDLQGNFIEVNRKHTECLGYKPEEMIGKSIAMLIPEDDLPKLGERFDIILAQGGVENLEVRTKRKDGSIFYSEMDARLLHDREGKPIECWCILRDITRRKQLEEQLLQAQKMESIGQLAGGVAHDFNNLLTAILGYSQLSIDSGRRGDEIEQNLIHIMQTAQRAAGLTRQLLAFSRRQISEPRVANLNGLVEGMLDMLRRLIGSHVRLEASLTSLPANVKVDPGQIEQVLMNLVVNARDAMPDGGQITIETAHITIDNLAAMTISGLTSGNYIRMSVRDTGHGMPEDVRARLFEPFFTTKEVGKGTGLGLSVCHGLVKQNGGHITFDSALGQGTTFSVFLPLVDEEQEADGRSNQPKLQTREGLATVLVAEDEDLIRRLICGALRDNGCAVLEARDGEEALQVASEFAGKIDLVLTDVVMPRMGGVKMVSCLRKQRPQIKVLYTSGYNQALVGDQDNPDAEFIQKPFLPATLSEKVRRVLNRAG